MPLGKELRQDMAPDEARTPRQANTHVTVPQVTKVFNQSTLKRSRLKTLSRTSDISSVNRLARMTSL